MAELRQHLIVAILKFFEDQRENGGLSEDAAESLEVAGQCLESAYHVDLLESKTLERYPVPPDGLLGVFQAGIDAKKETKRGPPASVADKEEADKLKAEGNDFMKQDMIVEAIDCYTRAIALDSNNAVYYCNRAAAQNKLSKFDLAINDCNTAIDIDRQYSKAYNRRGVAQMSIQKYLEARDSFIRALELDPTNEGYKASLEQAEQRVAETQRAVGGGPPGGLNLGGLDFSSMLNNPALMNMATSMMSNPQMQQMMANLMRPDGGAPEGAPGPGPGPGPVPGGIGNLLQAGQQLAQQMQETNPELVDQLRQQMRDGDSEPDPSGGGS